MNVYSIIRNILFINEDLTKEVGQQKTGSVGARRNRKKERYKTSLGALEMRKWGGNQQRSPATYNISEMIEDAKAKVIKKLNNKNNKAEKTDTNQTSSTIIINPHKPELTTYT